MSFDITCYATYRVKAEAHTAGVFTNWVDLIIIDGRRRDSRGSELKITMFFEDGPAGAAKAQAYAEAISAADRSLHPLDVARELAEDA